MNATTGHSREFTCTVHYSAELGRLVLVRADGTVQDVAFGEREWREWRDEYRLKGREIVR